MELYTWVKSSFATVKFHTNLYESSSGKLEIKDT